jgi:hypothetical protein
MYSTLRKVLEIQLKPDFVADLKELDSERTWLTQFAILPSW